MKTRLRGLALALSLDDSNNSYVTLEHSFNQLFDIGNYKTCLLTIGAYTVAVFIPFPEVFQIFHIEIHVYLVRVF